MLRTIIKIEQEKCDGCGLCADACHEGAIGIVDGKAVLLREDYCDGLGNCLPACPTGAISFEEREARPFDEAAVAAALKAQSASPTAQGGDASSAPAGELSQWPVKIRLVPPTMPRLQGSDLLIAADCAAFARASFHAEFMRGRITLIGCPKFDGTNCLEKLTAIFSHNSVNSVTVVKMEVPCCGGMEYLTTVALKESSNPAPLQVVTLSVNGEVIEEGSD
ncbi:MAG: 4Fe-4S binding protein [Coriobacteriales bacterium]|jgi:ferredoxin|nr:4Fe-4S binding protein [Coriobacteriales bacterium]